MTDTASSPDEAAVGVVTAILKCKVVLVPEETGSVN